VITDIYSVAGRESERIKKKVNSQKLVNAIKEHKSNVYYISGFDEIKSFLSNNLKKGDICIIMGAGDIWKLTEKLFEK